MAATKIGNLRKLMQQHHLDAYVVPGTDQHQNEYLPALWKRREWISGFTGSAGTVVVTRELAGLWTDFRYYLQAEQQLAGSGIVLFRLGQPDVPDPWQWLAMELEPGMRVGIDPRLITARKAAHVLKMFRPGGLNLQFLEDNLVDRIWENRPGLPLRPAVPHPESCSGEPVVSKLQRLRTELEKRHCAVIVLSKLDSIAWLYNLRGTDIAFNPVVIAYALVTQTTASLFISPGQVTAELEQHLAGLVEICKYTDFKGTLTEYNRRKLSFLVDDTHNSAWVTSLIDGDRLFTGTCPVIYFKAVKNTIEIKNFQQAHIRDGVALVKFLFWLEQAVPAGGVTEASAAEKLRQFRMEQAMYREESFPAISAYKDHAAIVHYDLEGKQGYTLESVGLYLIDSGAHYLDGTTDITRTIALGEPTTEQQENFTRVLKGHIDLAQCSFPEGTQGIQLDAIARKPLWDHGLDYGHGTGHGIGSYLNVHEGPHAISQARGVLVKLQPGMFCSNEPGYYKAGEYGIRIENIVYIARDEDKSSAGQVFYKFKTISLCPIDLRLVKKTMLSPGQLAFLNAYHQVVRQQLSPFLDTVQQNWLDQATRPL